MAGSLLWVSSFLLLTDYNLHTVRFVNNEAAETRKDLATACITENHQDGFQMGYHGLIIKEGIHLCSTKSFLGNKR